MVARSTERIRPAWKEDFAMRSPALCHPAEEDNSALVPRDTCDACAETISTDGVVDMDDLLELLAASRPCE